VARQKDGCCPIGSGKVLVNALTGQVNFVDCARANTRIPEFETNQWVSTEVIEKKLQKEVARPERFELPTLWFEARCSIQLSHRRVPQVSL
jgi:hypothetical protein